MAEKTIEDFKGGIVVGEDYETINWLLDEHHTKEGHLHLLAYDAALMPLMEMSTWDKGYAKKHIRAVLKQTEDFPGNVYMDGVQVK